MRESVRMATPGTWRTLDHRLQALSINPGSSSPSPSFSPISKEDETSVERCGVEQFLDLKTGELCYYDWSAGRKTKNDPSQLLRVKEAADRPEIEELSTSSEEEEDDDDDSDDSESMEEDSEDSQESPFPSPKEVSEGHGVCTYGGNGDKDPTVLVAAGCQSCLMYYMLPKYVAHCPKCGTVVLHFNEPESATTSKGKESEETNTG